MNDMTNPPQMPSQPPQQPQYAQAPGAPPAKKKSLGKILGIGCLTLIIIAAIGGYFLYKGVTSLLKGSQPYKDSITAVQSNPAAVAALGEPIETDSIPSGNISLNNDDGKVDFSIPVKGPKGKGTIIVKGTKTDGVWSYQIWQLNIEGDPIPIPLGK